MKKILHIISSPRSSASMSIKLGNEIIEKIKTEYPGSTVTVVDLIKTSFPQLEEVHINSFFTPKEKHTNENKAALQHSDNAIKQIMDADILVIDAPMYNFGIPSALKAWIDHIARAGVTFKMSEHGPEGLIKNKKGYIALSSGGVYSSGAMSAYDFTAPYLKAVFGFLGLTDISVFRIEGTNVPGVKETAVEKGLESIML